MNRASAAAFRAWLAESAEAAASEPSTDDSGGEDGAGKDGAPDATVTDDVDFPIPAPDGLVLDALVDAGIDMAGGGQRQLHYGTDDFDRLVTYYDEWTGQNGDWAKNEVDGTIVFQDVGGEFIRAITITPDHDPGAQADGPVTFLLLVTNE